MLQELQVGLEGYIFYKTKHNGDPAEYELWKKAILSRVKQKLDDGQNTLYPQGGTGEKEVAELQKHLVFLKEDRAPHVVVAMCKHRYMYERDRYLFQGQTFQVDEEGETNIMERHKQYHDAKGLKAHNRLPYIYGIWKSAKRNLRWISGVRKEKQEKEKEKPCWYDCGYWSVNKKIIC